MSYSSWLDSGGCQKQNKRCNEVGYNPMLKSSEALCSKTSPLYVHCKDCLHYWVAATAPMAANAFIALVKQNDTCPECGGKHLMCGWSKPQPAGATLENVSMS